MSYEAWLGTIMFGCCVAGLLLWNTSRPGTAKTVMGWLVVLQLAVFAVVVLAEFIR